jgi:hypothetical protein
MVDIKFKSQKQPEGSRAHLKKLTLPDEIHVLLQMKLFPFLLIQSVSYQEGQVKLISDFVGVILPRWTRCWEQAGDGERCNIYLCADHSYFTYANRIILLLSIEKEGV